MKRLTFILAMALLLSLAVANYKALSPPAKAAVLTLTTTALLLNKDDPAQMRVGELIYRGGLALTSADKNFGGISGMRIGKDGIVLAVSDAGSWISFRLVEKKERLIGATGIGLAPLLDKDGNPGTKLSRDAEALEANADSLSYTIAFEGDHRLWTYQSIDPAQPATFSHPAASEQRFARTLLWPNNGGMEALCRNGKAQTIFSEEAVRTDGGFEAFQGDMSFGYKAADGFKPTDCTYIPETSQMLMMERHFTPFTGVAAVISVVDLAGVTQDQLIMGREIARLAPPLSVDNMEGISYVARQGRKFIYIVSDDNFSGVQRTLLMKFEWLPKP